MAEYNIFEIIRSEKKKLSSISTVQVSKVFAKYYWKYINELKDKFMEMEGKMEEPVISFVENESIIGNFLFHIFYAIYLTSFNIHISIFFLERASLLFFEFISLSIQEKEYKVECKSYVNDAIIFTYKKTMGNISLDNILEENRINVNIGNQEIYQQLLSIRDSSYVFIKILNKFLLGEEIENNKKIYKNINDMLVKIYLNLDLDKYIYDTITNILDKYNLDISILLIKSLLEVIIEFINIDFFTFHTQKEDRINFINNLDIFFQRYIDNNNLEILSEELDLKKNNFYQDFKEDIIRYLTTN